MVLSRYGLQTYSRVWFPLRQQRGTCNLLMDLAKEYIDTTKCKNQNDLATVLRHKLSPDEAFEAFRRVDRALFLPKSPEYREPYANKPQNVGPVGANGATLSTPFHHALILSTLHQIGLKPGQTVLDLGCGSGWLTAAIFYTVGKNGGGTVVAMDRVPELLEVTKQCLKECPITTGAQESGRIVIGDAFSSIVDDKPQWNDALLKSKSPFDFIHVGFAFESAKDTKTIEYLVSLLRDTDESRMLAGWDNDLCLFDRKEYRKELAHIPGMAVVERSTYQKPLSRAEKLEQTKMQLDAWKALFEEKNKRKPSKADLFNDPLASQLFKQFATLTKLS